jgi:hypothetical protein
MAKNKPSRRGGQKAMREWFIAALGPALVLFISEVFRWFHAKKEQEERFFYELYPKRLELYEEIIKVLAFVDDVEQISAAGSASEIIDIYNQGMKRLLPLNLRCRLFGSPRVTAALNALAGTKYGHSKFVLEHQELFEHEVVADEFINAFTETIAARKGAIIELIQLEAGTNLVDKKFAYIVSKFNKKKNKPGKKEKGVIED